MGLVNLWNVIESETRLAERFLAEKSLNLPTYAAYANISRPPSLQVQVDVGASFLHQ